MSRCLLFSRVTNNYPYVSHPIRTVGRNKVYVIMAHPQTHLQSQFLDINDLPFSGGP